MVGVFVGTRLQQWEPRSLLACNNDLGHIIAAMTLDTIVAFGITFE
jgi:hypothetical protein